MAEPLVRRSITRRFRLEAIFALELGLERLPAGSRLFESQGCLTADLVRAMQAAVVGYESSNHITSNGAEAMLFATRYKFKGDQSPDTVKALLAVFAERGAAAGEIAHYVAADGRGGLVISENDSMQQGYEDALVYQQWMEFETIPVLTIEDAMPTIMKVFG